MAESLPYRSFQMMGPDGRSHLGVQVQRDGEDRFLACAYWLFKTRPGFEALIERGIPTLAEAEQVMERTVHDIFDGKNVFLEEHAPAGS